MHRGILARFTGGGGVHGAKALLHGVLLNGYRGCMWRPTDASQSTSLLPSIVRCEGTLIQMTSRPSLSNSESMIS